MVVPVVLTTGNEGSSTHEMEFTSLIVDLCSPRHLTVHTSKLFIPEAGVGSIQDTGDSMSCLNSSQSTTCFGMTGQVSVYNLDGTSAGSPQVEGLFSVRRGYQVYGASAVDFDQNGNMFTMVGLGFFNVTELMTMDPDIVFASVLRDDQPVASPWVPAFEKNYAGVTTPESNPFHLFMHNGR